MQCNYPIWIEDRALLERGQYVPCGKCIDCLEQKRSIWTFRILQELKDAESAYFLTLTYDEKYQPYVAGYGTRQTANKWGTTQSEIKLIEPLFKLPDQKNGWKAHYVEPSLRPGDLTNFIKKLRSRIQRDHEKHFNGVNKAQREEVRRYLKESKKTFKISPKLRYFACGEYGSKGERPHFHAIFYNIPINYISWDPVHNEYYSNVLEELWGMGMIHIGKVERGSAHYVAKYTIKAALEQWPKDDPRQKPYAVMSRNPGLGLNYLNNEQTRNYFTRNKISHTRLASGHIQPIGRYYKDKIWPKKEVQGFDGLQIYPEGRTTANKKTREHANKLKIKEEEKFIKQKEGDISEGQEALRVSRNERYERAKQLRIVKQAKNKKL